MGSRERYGVELNGSHSEAARLGLETPGTLLDISSENITITLAEIEQLVQIILAGETTQAQVATINAIAYEVATHTLGELLAVGIANYEAIINDPRVQPEFIPELLPDIIAAYERAVTTHRFYNQIWEVLYLVEKYINQPNREATHFEEKALEAVTLLKKNCASLHRAIAATNHIFKSQLHEENLAFHNS